MNTRGTDIDAFTKLQNKLRPPSKAFPKEWEESYYSQYVWERKNLAPNVAVYCETPVMAMGSTTLSSNHKTIRVLNLIGVGFDTSTHLMRGLMRPLGRRRNIGCNRMCKPNWKKLKLF